MPPLGALSPDDSSDICAVAPSAARRRGPSVEKTTQTQRQVTEAALALFLEHGISRTTMAQIAERAAVGKGTIYSYYPSKAGLLRGVVEYALAQSMIYLPPVRRRRGESVQSLLRRSLLPTMASIEHSDRAGLARLILSESTQHRELARLYKELAFDPWHEQVVELLELARAEGELVGDAVRDYAYLLGSPFWQGMVHNGLLTGDAQQKVPIRPLVESLIALLFKPVTLPIAAPAASAMPPDVSDFPALPAQVPPRKKP